MCLRLCGMFDCDFFCGFELALNDFEYKSYSENFLFIILYFFLQIEWILDFTKSSEEKSSLIYFSDSFKTKRKKLYCFFKRC